MITITTSIPIIIFIALQFENSKALFKSPIKQYTIIRAFSSTVTEAVALNVFDQSSLYKELFCNCDNYVKTAVYTSGFVIFSYMFLGNSDKDKKLNKFNSYKKSKQIFRALFLIILLFFNKEVHNVY